MKRTKIWLLMLFAVTLALTSCTNAKDPEPDPNTKPDSTVVGDGTKAKPFSVAEVITMNPQSTTVAVQTGIWMSGYMVGFYNGTPSPSILETAAPFTDDVNVMLAVDSTETDMAKCVCVQLPAGAVRTALGLKTTPLNKGKKILVHGDIMKYNLLPGIKNTDAYWFVAANTGIEPPTAGSFNVPEMTITDLRAEWTGTMKTLTDQKKIVGVVVTDLVGGNSGSLKNLTIASLDNSAGIMVRLVANNTYNLGDKIEISLEGLELNQYGLAIQLNNVPNASTQKIGTATITPKVTTIANVIANYASLESTVVTLTGTITSPNGNWGSTTANQNNTLTSGTNQLTLYVAKYATFVSTAVPTGEKSVTGIVGQYSTATAATYQLIVRNLDDVK